MVANRRRPAFQMLLLVIPLLLLAACTSNDPPADEISLTPTEVLPPSDRVDDLVASLRSGNTTPLEGQFIEIVAWISAAPLSSTAASTPPQGCPVVPDKQDWLTDEPVVTHFELAGARLPNRFGSELPFLRLAVPYRLGFIDIPERARLRGTVLDPAYAGCPMFESLFVLEEIIEELPAQPPAGEVVAVGDWQTWRIHEAELTIEFPEGWLLEERDTGGAVVHTRFLSPDEHPPIQFLVSDGETFWHPSGDVAQQPPELLRGDRVVEAFAGSVTARLVDDSSRAGPGERELRLVFNHAGNTVSLWTIVEDGVALDLATISILSQMASRVQLHGEIGITDPLDPLLGASEELGDGPFLSEADALYLAITGSGLIGPQPTTANLVSEREARMITTGACRSFDGSPEGVWLVTVEGSLPGGEQKSRLVYIDAVTGIRLCQAEAPDQS